MKLSEEILYRRPGVGFLLNASACVVLAAGMLILNEGAGGTLGRAILVALFGAFLMLAAVILSCRRHLLDTAERAQRLEDELAALREAKRR